MPIAPHMSKRLLPSRMSLGCSPNTKPFLKFIVPVMICPVGRVRNNASPFPRVSIQPTLQSEFAAFVSVHEQMQLRDAFGYSHYAEPLIAKCGPARNAKQSLRRKCAFRSFSKTQPAFDRLRKTDSTRAL